MRLKDRVGKLERIGGDVYVCEGAMTHYGTHACIKALDRKTDSLDLAIHQDLKRTRKLITDLAEALGFEHFSETLKEGFRKIKKT